MSDRVAYLGVRPDDRLADVLCTESVPEPIRQRMMHVLVVLRLPAAMARQMCGCVLSEARLWQKREMRYEHSMEMAA